MQYLVIELQGSDVITHGEYADFDFAEAALKNVKRRAAVKGECFAAVAVEEEVASDFTAADVANFDDAEYGYVTFSEAAKLIGVRYQQVYQRAVTKSLMAWQLTTALFVSLKDVESWKQQRFERLVKANAAAAEQVVEEEEVPEELAHPEEDVVTDDNYWDSVHAGLDPETGVATEE